MQSFEDVLREFEDFLHFRVAEYTCAEEILNR